MGAGLSALVFICPSSEQRAWGPGHARAGGIARIRGSGRFTTLGLSGGFQLDPGALAVVGVEASFVRVRDSMLWYGAYGDLRYHHGVRGIDLSVGGEFGYAFVGVDAGVYGRLGDRRAEIGFRARGCLTVGVASACAGGGFVHRSGAFFEGTLLLKYLFDHSEPPGHRDRSGERGAIGEGAPD